MHELGMTPLEILDDARKRFACHVSSPEAYVVHRRLRAQPDSEENTESYLEVLPTFRGEDFISLVNKKIANNRATASADGTTPQPVRILDIGYGNGSFLLDARAEWGAAVELVGLGNDTYAKNGVKYGSAGIDMPPTINDIEGNGIKLVNGSVVDIRKLFGDNTLDFIVSSYALMYVPYPQWELIKKIYRTLKPDGIALLDYSARARSLIRSISEYLGEQGYEFDTESGIAFRKTNPDINLPIRTVDWENRIERLVLNGHLQELKEFA